MNKYLKKIGLFLLLFLVVFITVWLLGFINNCFDPLNSYGFSKAIMMGQVPYRDFNTVTTPLYAFYQSVFLFIYDDFIMIMISQALLVTISACLIYKMFGKKSFILLLVVFLVQYKALVATYNFMCLFMIILLIYLEKYHNDKDYLIGFVIGLGLLSKHIPGVFLIIPSIIFYRRSGNKLVRRFIGFLGPCLSFLIYLFVTGALFEFFNLCLFGMLDFGNDNGVAGGNVHLFYIVTTLLTFIYSLYLLFKNKKDINIYYLIFGVFFAIPLFDITHTSIWFLCFCMIVLPYIKKYVREISYLCLVLFCFFSIFWIFMWFSFKELCFTKELNHFRYYIQDKSTYNNLLIIDKFVSEYDSPIILGHFSMQYSIIHDKELDSFSILYRGNFGYNGIDKMLNKIKKMNDQIFLISISDYKNSDKDSQFCKELAEYVIKNCKFIEEKNGFYVYYKE